MKNIKCQRTSLFLYLNQQDVFIQTTRPLSQIRFNNQSLFQQKRERKKIIRTTYHNSANLKKKIETINFFLISFFCTLNPQERLSEKQMCPGVKQRLATAPGSMLKGGQHVFPLVRSRTLNSSKVLKWETGRKCLMSHSNHNCLGLLYQ